MNDEAARAVAEDVGRSLAQSLGAQLAGLYLYGSVVTGGYHADYSDVNLLALVADDLPLATFRDAFQPLWSEHGATLRSAPLLLPVGQLARFATLFPALMTHWQADGRLLAGAADPLTAAAPPPTPDPREPVAQLANEALRVSALLAPEMLDEVQQTTYRQRLDQLVWQLTGEPVPDAPVTELLTVAHRILATRVTALATTNEEMGLPEMAPPALLPALLAIYERGEEAIFVLNEPMDAALETSDWPAVSAAMAGNYYTLGVTTPAQFRLIVELALPVEYCVGYFSAAWGVPLPAPLPLDAAELLSIAARQPAWLRAAKLPEAYLTTPADGLGRVIHDFQNKLLNIQLQYELLCRLKDIDGRRPPPLPDRTSPPPERIAAIDAQLEWWVDQLLAEAFPKDAG